MPINPGTRKPTTKRKPRLKNDKSATSDLRRFVSLGKISKYGDKKMVFDRRTGGVITEQDSLRIKKAKKK